MRTPAAFISCSSGPLTGLDEFPDREAIPAAQDRRHGGRLRGCHRAGEMRCVGLINSLGLVACPGDALTIASKS
jgi:hypothetical protein